MRPPHNTNPLLPHGLSPGHKKDRDFRYVGIYLTLLPPVKQHHRSVENNVGMACADWVICDTK